MKRLLEPIYGPARAPAVFDEMEQALRTQGAPLEQLSFRVEMDFWVISAQGRSSAGSMHRYTKAELYTPNEAPK